MRKWIQLIVTLLVLVLFLLPLTTVPMDRTVTEPTTAPVQSGESAGMADDSAQVVSAENTAEPALTAEPTAAPTAEPTAEPTAAPTAEPEATPVPELPACIPVNNGSYDAEGETAIAEIQQRLIDLNYLFDVADGVFGNNSVNAVTEFQAANGLPEYGIVDEQTYYALFSANVIAAPEPTPTPMGYGSSGENVTLVQDKLAMWGFLAFEPDGAYGEGTQTGVKNFQQYLYDHGETLATEVVPLLLGAGETPTPEPTAEPTPEPTPAPTAEPEAYSSTVPTAEPTLPGNLPVVIGSRDSETDTAVQTIQQRLIDLGYLNDVADGAFGANSSDAVSRFQSDAGIAQSGTVDETTWRALFSASAAAVTPAPTLEPTPTPYAPSGVVDDELLAYLTDGRFDIYRQDVRNGDQNDEAFRIQRRLACLDYMYTSACDGAFGDVTELALKYFQKRNNLPETGVADEATQKVLFSADAKASSYIVYPYNIVVDISDQRTYAYQWTGDGYTTDPVQTFICSTGTKKNPTPLGTYSADGIAGGQWYYFKDFKCYAQYAYRIFGGILFHSITYDQPKESTIHRGALNNLGNRASHGCIRLTVENAKWIYEHCPAGTTVTIQE